MTALNPLLINGLTLCDWAGQRPLTGGVGICLGIVENGNIGQTDRAAQCELCLWKGRE
jgi:hypothetical protein